MLRSSVRGAAAGLALALALPVVTAADAGFRGQSPQAAQAASTARSGRHLYRFTLLQAAPGRLLDLISFCKATAAAEASAGDDRSFLVRHSQGDHWDILIVRPVGGYGDYYAPARSEKRRVSLAAAGFPANIWRERHDLIVSWHSDLYLEGPPPDALHAYVRDSGLIHLEMLQALPGRRQALIAEREMENAFQRGRGLPDRLIFVQDQGGPWDTITLAAYRNWRHYAESETVSPETSAAAARAAGFASAAEVGVYMRSLIATHRDTLGPPIPF